jgi:hypothetical protein
VYLDKRDDGGVVAAVEHHFCGGRGEDGCLHTANKDWLGAHTDTASVP